MPLKVEENKNSVTIQKGEVKLIFEQTDAPKNWTCSEPFPITIPANTQRKLTFKTEATKDYNEWSETVTVKCTKLDILEIETLTVYGKGIESDDSVTLDESLGQVTQSNVEVKFKQKGADVPLPKYTGLPITLKAGMSKTFTISTDATEKYEAFTRTVTVKATKTEVPKKPSLNVKTLTIHGKSAASGKVTISTDKNQVIKADIKLEFLEEGDGVPASDDFAIYPESVSLANAGDKATLTLSTQETTKYAAWELIIEVTRAKAEGEEKTIDDCIDALTSQLAWAGIAVDKPISLPVTVTGYDGSTVAWTCADEHVDATTGNITQDLANVTVEVQAKVAWKGKEKTVTFKVTVQRLKKISWKDGQGTTEIDLSKEGILLYSLKNDPRFEFEIKNVDVKAKRFTAKILKRKKNVDKLKSIDEIIEFQVEDRIKLLENFFKLEEKENITWEELKKYVAFSIGHINDDDNFLFPKFKDKSGYNGTLEAFKALQPSERNKFVKVFIKAFQNKSAVRYGIDKNLPTQDFLAQLKVKVKESITIYFKHMGKEFTWGYVLEKKNNDPSYPDGYAFEAKTIYDPQRQWYDQMCTYEDDARDKNILMQEYNGKLDIFLRFSLGNNKSFFGGAEAIPASLPLELNDGDDKNPKKLNCTMSSTQDGKLTCIVTEGEYAGTYELRFNALSMSHIYSFY